MTPVVLKVNQFCCVYIYKADYHVIVLRAPPELCLLAFCFNNPVQPVLLLISSNFCALDNFFISASRFKAFDNVEQVST